MHLPAKKGAPMWKTETLSVVDGFIRHLAASAPRTAHVRLELFRQEFTRAKNQRECKKIEQRLEVLMKSRPYFRGAGRRTIQALCKQVIKNCKVITKAVQEFKTQRAKFARDSTGA